MTQTRENTFEMEEDTLKGRFLIFYIGQESYGIEIKYVTEIIGMEAITQITPMPELPDYMKGIINLRGKIIPIMDIRLRFKKEPVPYNERTCIVVVNIKDISIGLIIDSVSEVLSINDQDIVDPPRINSDINNRYIKKIGKVDNEVKLLLDCEKLLAEDEWSELNEAI
jgi:purine-binding chemotaxis protein CheW